MVALNGKGYLIRNGQAWLWSFDGYKLASANLEESRLLTPPSAVRAFRAGYRPSFDSYAAKRP
jgi:hypothetical protein